jgi:hypothetical protein
MTNNARVLNVSKGFTLKHKQALRAIEQCAAEWIVFGESIRDLSLSESIVKRNEQAKSREPIANAEIPGLVFQHSGAANERRLAQEANLLCAVR